jgi:hypothetical protein
MQLAIQIILTMLFSSKCANYHTLCHSNYREKSVAMRNHNGVKNVFYNRHLLYVRFEVFMAVTMNNAVFWDVIPCGSCKNGRSRGT